MNLKAFLIVGVPFLAAAVACSSSSGTPDEPVAEADAPISQAADLRFDQFPLIKGLLSADGLQAIFATPDLGLGESRVAFVLTSREGLVRSPVATVSSSFFRGGEETQGELRQTALAVFRPWPYGTRGTYTTRLTLDEPGRWGLDITVLGTDGSGRRAELFFDVEATASAPAVGSPATKSINKTLEDVERISQLSTGSMHDPDLYQITIAEAVASGLPTVVVMASPAFCTNAVCGPQVEVLSQIKDSYRGRAHFIHVDIYDNPEEIQGDLTRGLISPTVVEWNLPSTEWSFVIDSNGIVSARFESFATLEEVEEALLKVF